MGCRLPAANAPSGRNDVVVHHVADHQDERHAALAGAQRYLAAQALAIEAATATLLRTAQMLASRLAPPDSR